MIDYEFTSSYVKTENDGYLRGLSCALSIVRHSKDLLKAEESIRNAIDQANLVKSED